MHRRNFLYALVGAAGATMGASILSRAEAAQLDRPAGTPEPDGERMAQASGDGPASDRLPSNADIQEVQYRRRYHRGRYHRGRYHRGRYHRPAARWRRPVRRRVCVVRRNRWGRRVRVCTWR